MQKKAIYLTNSKENGIIQKVRYRCMKQELSAGAVICKKIRSTWNVLLIRDMKGMLTFPKGLIEKGEQSVETAKREAAEETGCTELIYVTHLPDVLYFYTRNGQSIKKVVEYFLFFTTNHMPLVPQTEEGITEIVWMPIEQALACIGYEKSNKPVVIAAQGYLKKLKE